METVVCCGFFCNRKRQLRAKGEEHEILSFVGSAYWKAAASLQYDRRTAGYIRKIVALAEREKPDAVLIAGDIYDTPVPSAEAVSVFDEFLTALNDLEPEVTVCIIAGNHDSAKRIDFASDILAKHRVMIAGMPPVTREETIRKVSF